jgi:hypothetical protein
MGQAIGTILLATATEIVAAAVGLCAGIRDRTQIVSTVAGTNPAAKSPATRRSTFPIRFQLAEGAWRRPPIPASEPRQAAARCRRLTRHPCWRSAKPAPAPRPWTQSTRILALSSSGPKHGGSFPAKPSRCCGAEPPSWPAIARSAPQMTFASPSAGLRPRRRDHKDWR